MFEFSKRCVNSCRKAECVCTKKKSIHVHRTWSKIELNLLMRTVWYGWKLKNKWVKWNLSWGCFINYKVEVSPVRQFTSNFKSMFWREACYNTLSPSFFPFTLPSFSITHCFLSLHLFFFYLLLPWFFPSFLLILLFSPLAPPLSMYLLSSPHRTTTWHRLYTVIQAEKILLPPQAFVPQRSVL